MKICHITTVHSRYDIRIFQKECISIAKAGHDVTLIVNDENDNEVIKGVRIISLKKRKGGVISRFLMNSIRRSAFMTALSVEADIYHFHDPELLPVGIKLVKKNKNVVYDAHEDTPRQILVKEWIPKYFRKIIATGFELYENWCAIKFSGVIVPTPHLKERFQVYNEKVWEVSNFPSLEEIEYCPDKYSVQNPACYVGDLTYARGVVEISKATELANKNLYICGNYYSDGLEEHIKSNFKNVQYMGYLNRADISLLLTHSSMGLVVLRGTPGYMKSYPIKMFEYMAAGIPVIVSDFQALRTIVDEHKCGICVDPECIQSIENAIKALVNNESEAIKMGYNGRKAVEKNYNWEYERSKLLSAYEVISMVNP